jgi:hypothetical protein
MPFATVRLQPGINTEKTLTLNQAGYSQSNLGRFRDGLFQKIGGWLKFYQFAVSGIPRALWGWQDLNSNKYLAVGSTTSLGAVTGGNFNNLTPQKLTTDFAPNFSTTIGSNVVSVVDSNIANVTTSDVIFFNTPIAVGGLILSGPYPISLITGTTSYQIITAQNATALVNNGGTVPTFTSTAGTSTLTVNLTAHGRAAGDSIYLPIATSVGGITVQGGYTIATVPNANSFTISGSAQASSGATIAMNSGNAELVYYITLGPAAIGTGYGLGGYGLGGYGTGVVPSSQTGTPITALDYSLDNWGQYLAASPKNGPIYYWDPQGGFSTAILIANAPLFNGGMFVAMPQQMIIAWGSTTSIGIGVQQDPLLVRWCDVGNFNQWIGNSTNQAGRFRISTGSAIIGAMQASNQSLLWTDIGLWSMNYIGAPLVYSFNEIGTGCGLVGQHAMCRLRGVVFWMGQSNFFMLSGNGVDVVPCSVWDVVFQDLDLNNLTKCRAAANTPFNEVFFYYPSLSGGTGECDKYVKFNMVEKTWDYGNLGRSAWIDQSVLGAPIGATTQGIIYQHETGNDADGSPINALMQTGYWSIMEGEDLAFVDWILPDFKWGTWAGSQTAQIQITILATNYPGDTPRVYGPYTVTQASQYINTRIRARQMAIIVQSNDVGSFWRLGSVRYRFAQDGRR